MAYYMGMAFMECPYCESAYIPSYWGDDDEACIDCDWESHGTARDDEKKVAARRAYYENGLYQIITTMTGLVLKGLATRDEAEKTIEYMRRRLDD